MIESEFNHPLLMNLLMFAGEASLLLVLSYQHNGDKNAKAAHEKNKASPILFVIPALLDTCGSYLTFVSLALISASSYQILKMLCMVFVVILSRTVLKKSYSLAQYLAILVIMCGITVVTLTDL